MGERRRRRAREGGEWVRQVLQQPRRTQDCAFLGADHEGMRSRQTCPPPA